MTKKTFTKTKILIIAAIVAVVIIVVFLMGLAGRLPDIPGSRSSEGGTVTLSISCHTILDNMEKLADGKKPFVNDGVILTEQEVSFSGGETVFDVLYRVCREKDIHMSSKWTPLYSSYYIEGINQIYEFDCGGLSGWMYRVNDKYPNYGCSKYYLQNEDVIEWIYTCDLGADIGGRDAVA